MADAYVLSEADVAILKELAAFNRNRRINQVNRPHVPDELYQTPDTLIARVPLGGIPALSEEAGAGVGTGSGSGTAGTGDIPGSAVCELFKIQVDVNNANPTLQMIARQVTVYNLSSTNITTSLTEFVIVTRDKYGFWLVAFGLGGTMTGVACVGGRVVGTFG